jgi:ankyrin repeat protein
MARGRLLRGGVAGFAGALCLSALLHAAPSTSAVADAAMKGDAEAVHALLKQAADVNGAQGDGMTALHWAAMNGHADLTQTLIYAGANVRATTRIGGYTPLFLASQSGQGATIRALLKAGADVTVGSPNGTTPLMVAAASGRTDAVAALLDHGADINATESLRGHTALIFAAASNRAAVIELLTSRGADVTAATKVIDLGSLTRERLQFFGNPPPPPREGQAAAPAQGQQAATAPSPEPGQARPQQGAAAKESGQQAPAAPQPAASGRPAAPQRRSQIAGIDRQYQLNELVSAQGGLTPLLFAARDGYMESVEALLEAGADVNQVSEGDQTSPLLIAVINGHFDLARVLIDKGADVTRASENGATPLYAALNVEWAPKALYPQPRAYEQQRVTYLEMMKLLLEKGADPNARLTKKVWYSGYSFDLSGVDEIGATPFWRAAYASDVDAMRLLVANGADPNIPTMKPAGRPRTGDGDRENVQDVSGLPPVPLGGPSVTPLQAAAGVGYGEGFAANAHRFAPGGMMAAVKYLVEEAHADVNAVDHEGNTALHHAAARGDNEMIQYLVSKGANVMVVNREGNTTVDMANGPVQRTQPYPETIALLEKLGAKNNHKCVSC